MLAFQKNVCVQTVYATLKKTSIPEPEVLTGSKINTWDFLWPNKVFIFHLFKLYFRVHTDALKLGQ